MNSITRSVIAVVLGSSMFACATSEKSPRTLEDILKFEEKIELKGYQLGTPENSINNFRINGWSYVDDRHIIVNTGVRDDFLISFQSNCREAKYSESLAFTDTAGRLTTSDRFIIKGAGGFDENCYVQTITHLVKVRGKKPDQ
ncbi:MAG: hypothetical protein ACI9H8_001399 [Lysobacterales bacterium]|jgi:hypothetical protein